jgi:hypothetical protein
MSALSSRPELNPEIKSFIASAAAKIKDGALKLAEKSSGFPIIALIVIVVAVIGLMIWFSKQAMFFETPTNTQRVTKDATQAQARYDMDNPKRVHLRDYLTALKGQGVPDAHLALTNFYISTVNATGVFLPGYNSTVSPMAVRAAVLAGARCFVFDVWPDVSPGANFGPSIQVVEAGSNWRRITLNSAPLAPLLKVLITETLEVDRPGNTDPVFIYLRFRGKQRSSTYDGTLNALRATIEQYRLESPFNACRSQDRVFAMPITSFFKKVVVISNTNAGSHPLSDYINIGPKAGIKQDWGTIEARGLSSDTLITAQRNIQQNLTFVAPLSEDPSADTNSWSIKESQDIGIQFVAMNLWDNNDNLKAYQAPDMFGRQSFKIKPVPLRYIIEILANPLYPENPHWGTGPTSGSPTIPPAIKMP